MKTRVMVVAAVLLVGVLTLCAQVPGLFSTIVATVSVTAPSFIGNASTATALAATPTQCSTGAASGIAANGNANCAGITFAPSQHNYGSGTGCRVLNYSGTCQNTGANALVLSITTSTGAGPAAGSIIILDGPTTSTAAIASATGNASSSGAVSAAATVIIPAGYYYNATVSGTQFQSYWVEWTTP